MNGRVLFFFLLPHQKVPLFHLGPFKHLEFVQLIWSRLACSAFGNHVRPRNVTFSHYHDSAGKTAVTKLCLQKHVDWWHTSELRSNEAQITLSPRETILRILSHSQFDNPHSSNRGSHQDCGLCGKECSGCGSSRTSD